MDRRTRYWNRRYIFWKVNLSKSLYSETEAAKWAIRYANEETVDKYRPKYGVWIKCIKSM